MTQLLDYDDIKATLRALIPRRTVERITYQKQRHLSEIERSTIFIVFDACRYDSFSKAYENDFPGTLRKAWSPACWTLPSHESIIRDIPPACEEVRNVYINEYRGLIMPIPLQHHYSFGSVALLPLQKNKHVKSGIGNYFNDYSDFHLEAPEYDQVLDYARKCLGKVEHYEDFYGLINLEETHWDYPGADYDKEQVKKGEISKDRLMQDQARGARILIDAVQELREDIPAGTQVIVSADHGDLFGEGGGWFHNPTNNAVFHRKLFEVPLISWVE